MTTFDITGWAVDLMDRLGGPGAGLAIALENLFPPLPSEVLLPIAGLTASQGRMGLAEAVLWTTAGSVAGAAVLYWLAAAFGRDRLLAVAVRLPLVRREDVERPRPGSRGTAARRCSWAAWCRWSAAWSLVRARPAAPGPERPLRTTRAMSAGPRFVTGWLRLVAGVGAGARWLTSLDRRRVAWLGRTAVTGDGVPAGRAGRYLALRVPVGLFGGGIVAVFLWGAGTAAGVAGLWLRGHEVDGLRPTPALVAYFLGAGATLMFLNLAGVAAVHRLEERWAAGACASSGTSTTASSSASSASGCSWPRPARRRPRRARHPPRAGARGGRRHPARAARGRVARLPDGAGRRWPARRAGDGRRTQPGHRQPRGGAPGTAGRDGRGGGVLRWSASR